MKINQNQYINKSRFTSAKENLTSPFEYEHVSDISNGYIQSKNFSLFNGVSDDMYCGGNSTFEYAYFFFFNPIKSKINIYVKNSIITNHSHSPLIIKIYYCVEDIVGKIESSNFFCISNSNSSGTIPQGKIFFGNELDKIYNSLCKLTPIVGAKTTLAYHENAVTEAEAVCSYALSQNFGLNSNNMFLGIDVGGSTSDILLLAKDSDNGNKATLYRESSVRLAAGVFFNAVIKSEAFRQALLSFHGGHKTNVYVSNIKEILTEPSKAPYFSNSIFDQLKTAEDYEEFYSSIDANAKFVFTIPAYVTGMLLYYSGMLIGRLSRQSIWNVSQELMCYLLERVEGSSIG